MTIIFFEIGKSTSANQTYTPILNIELGVCPTLNKGDFLNLFETEMTEENYDNAIEKIKTGALVFTHKVHAVEHIFYKDSAGQKAGYIMMVKVLKLDPKTHQVFPPTFS